MTDDHDDDDDDDAMMRLDIEATHYAIGVRLLAQKEQEQRDFLAAAAELTGEPVWAWESPRIAEIRRFLDP